MQAETIEVSNPERLVKSPRVSVLMITFNHAGYIAEAIEGVLRQECDFPIELIIGEDASTDATLQVALEYQRRHPEIIRVVHSAANVGMNANALRIFAKARGGYVAYCEGDDFWCAPDKLARQVALMESDDRIGIVHTDWTRATFQDVGWKHDARKSVHRRVPLRYLRGNIFKTWHYPKILRTCTILLRKQSMEDWYQSGLMDDSYLFGDSVLSAWITSRWQVGYIPAVTAVYRVSPNSALRSGAGSRVAFYRSALKFDTAARTYFSGITDYPSGYRWESAVGLLLWGLRARDFSAAKDALRDLCRHFTVAGFVIAALHAVIMRLPSIRRLRDTQMSAQ
ncbi:glycosyltransferase [Dokdonella sp.]|uniref:glycosyltransferase family 2 protein n=1 Tax=Dokdonella sp. TaxID=2291710 RepID=UPI0025BBF675|nr:glycosyltransferase [Dokdonella sp.]MBX3692102.1 glycosyltransferase [Dokdonella sp.]